MDNSKFDKFIRENTKKELETPDALDWENMNIPLPQKKKRRKYFFWMWFLAGLLLFVAGAYYSWYAIQSPDTNFISTENSISASKEAKTDSPKTDKDNQIERSSKATNKSSISTSEIKTATKETSNELSTSSDTSSRASTTNYKPNDNNAFVKNSNNNLGNKSLSSTTITNTLSENKTTEHTAGNLPMLLEEKKQKKNFELSPLSSILINLNAPKEDIEVYTDTKPIKLKKNKLFSTVLFSFGFNLAEKNYSLGNQLEALKQTEGMELGESYSIAFRHAMKNNFFLSAGLTYERLHTSFSYDETLSPIIDVSAKKKINRIKQIHHNNFLEYIELNIGAGRRFYFGKNWGADVLLQLNPSYRLSLRGRTLNEEFTVVNIEDFASDKKLFWSVSTGVNLVYLFKNYNLFLGANFKRSLQHIQLLNNSNVRFNHNVYNLNVGIITRF